MLSLQVEYSEKANKVFYFPEERIIPEESEGRSTPPGTIGDAQDIMSEQIKSNFLARKHNAPAPFEPSTFAERNSLLERKDSTFTKVSNFAMVKEKIILPVDNSHLNAFKLRYERLFREFKEKLVKEYIMLRKGYLQEYETSFQKIMRERDQLLNEY